MSDSDTGDRDVSGTKYMYEVRLSNEGSLFNRLHRRTPYREDAVDELKQNGGGTIYEYLLKFEAGPNNLETWELMSTIKITVEQDVKGERI